MLDLTDYLAGFGAITGGISLLINYRKHLESQPKYEVFFPDGNTGNYFTVNQFADAFTDEGRIIFYVRIENHSSAPVTITKYTLSIPQYNITDITSDSLIKAAKIYSSIVNDEKINVGDFQLLPPFKIEPFGAVQGYIFFVLPKFNLKASTESHLNIFNTRKLISKKINVATENI